jgi:hypothetical protein
MVGVAQIDDFTALRELLALKTTRSHGAGLRETARALCKAAMRTIGSSVLGTDHVATSALG